MLFNSAEFLFLFLPVTLMAFHGLKVWNRPAVALIALLVASLFFYGWWNPGYLLLMVASIACNYAVGRLTLALQPVGLARKVVVAAGVAANLAILGYYKYATFALATWAGLTGGTTPADDIILPLGISFFTFTQVSYLVDVHLGRTRPGGPLSYALFVTFFPHLVAGPIVHHRELAGQFAPAARGGFPWQDGAVGATLFAFGLFKKTVLADSLALHATPVFAAAQKGAALDFLTAWGGALAYTFQLYFDFSGYSDMAIGLSLMFGIRLPINFNSPYKATSIIDFWHRWHITLSHWLRDYLYVPLGGNRYGRVHQIAAVVTTMLLGGLWHGAGWTFLVWGIGHGVLLAFNHGWRAFVGVERSPTRSTRLIGWATTFTAVAVLWVIFRAPDLATAGRMLSAMSDPRVLPGFLESGLGTLGQHAQQWGWRFAVQPGPRLMESDLPRLLAASLLLAVIAPNLFSLLKAHRPYLPVKGGEPAASTLAWAPTTAWALVAGAMFAYGALNAMITSSEFLYFQF